MQRRTSRWRDARAGIWLLAIGFCLHHAPGWATAQNQGTPQEAELRRQLQVERAARLTLTYQADMRKAAQLAEIEEWQPLGAVAVVLQLELECTGTFCPSGSTLPRSRKPAGPGASFDTVAASTCGPIPTVASTARVWRQPRPAVTALPSR